MKFVHIADMHFDAPFAVLNSRNKLGEKRRLEQREVFRKIINYIKENSIEYLFIAGDLYEHEYIRKTTAEYINNLFKEIPNTKIYISPGNHDPYINNSIYKNFNWNDNVHIFRGKLEVVKENNCNIYGFGFNDFYCKNSIVDEIKIENKEQINILVAHGSLNGGTLENMEYNPMNRNKLKELGFDYVALGHIHKLDYNTEEEQRIVYPGSTISLGFDELGQHGMIVGELNKENIMLEFIPMDNKEFKEMELDISDINSEEELIEKINNLILEENTYYKIILNGDKNFEINIYNLFKFILNENIIKIKNKTKLKIDLEKISKNNNLKGLFVKEILDELNKENSNKELLENVLELGLEEINKK